MTNNDVTIENEKHLIKQESKKLIVKKRKKK